MDRSSQEILQGNFAEKRTNDLIMEILPRLPVKSLCRFKCVSWNLRRLITHPDHRKKLPQTLSGFFYCFDVFPTYDDGYHDGTFVNLGWSMGVEYVHQANEIPLPDFTSILPAEEEQWPIIPDRSLSFLPGNKSVVVKHCCSGHLLCFYWDVPLPAAAEDAQYLVCNPITQQWRTFPRSRRRSISDKPPPMFLCLDDDPVTTSANFHVMALIEDFIGCLTGLDIYSSESGAWSRIESGWGNGYRLLYHSVFLHGMLHLISIGMKSGILAVDRDGRTWNTIPLLEDMYDFKTWSLSDSDPLIAKSQGRLLYMNHKPDDRFTMSVWILEDYCSGGTWVLRCQYNINTPKVFGSVVPEDRKIKLVAVHPDCYLVFLIVGYDKKSMSFDKYRGGQKFISYDMDRGEVRLLRRIESFPRSWRDSPFVPYVPSFSRAMY